MRTDEAGCACEENFGLRRHLLGRVVWIELGWWIVSNGGTSTTFAAFYRLPAGARDSRGKVTL